MMATTAVPTPTPTAAAPRAARLRARVSTSPGRLRLAAVVLSLATLAFGLGAFDAVSGRRQAAQAAASQTEPLLIAAEGLYASLSDANATAATTFATGGLEPAVRRQRYVSDLQDATRELTTLTRQAGSSSTARQAVLSINTQLPVYSGLVETARTDNRQGFPVGAAYLRQASDLMRAQILPAAARLYQVEAQRLGDDYGSGVSQTAVIVLVVLAVLLLGLLVATQLYVTALTHRILSLPMLLATLVGVALTAWSVVALVSEQNALARAQRNGSDAVQLLAAARVLVLRAQADESLALVARGGDTQDLVDFTSTTQLLSRPGGLLDQAAVSARRLGSAAAINSLASDLARYEGVHNQVNALETNGRFSDAVKLVVGPQATELPLADRLNTSLEQQIAAARRRFGVASAAATSATDGLTLALPLLTVVLLGLTLHALARRLGEYR